MKYVLPVKRILSARIKYILPIIALLFVLATAWYSFSNLPDYAWSSKQLWWSLPAFFLYPISLVLLLLGWLEIIQGVGLTIDKALNLYLYCINFVTRRLPMGFLWSAGSRIAAYTEVGVKAKTLSIGMIWEFLLHNISALFIWLIFELLGFGFVQRLSENTSLNYIVVMAGMFVIGGSLSYIGIRQLWKRHQNETRVHVDVVRLGKIIVLYTLSWLNASLMLWLVSRIIMDVPVSATKLVAIWAFSGGVGGFLSLLPFLNIGIKEISLALLLSQFTSLPQATIIAIIFRLLLTLSDAIWPMFFALGLRGFIKRNISNKK